MTTTVSNGVLVEKQRISSIDLMRGIVMVIMALDHARDFFHIAAITQDPADVTTTTPILFFTRWITHYCAPTFVFLSGTSIALNLQKKSKKELSVFLLTRGLWLIFLEFTVCRFGILLNLNYDVIIFQVIGAIGASMIVLSALVHLSSRAILIIGLVIVFGHNLLDVIFLKPEDGVSFYIWSFLHQRGLFTIGSVTVLMLYPMLAWLGIMLCGFALGSLYYKSFDPDRRRKILLQLGLAAVGLFIVLRFINFYGDPSPWAVQPKGGVYTFLSFLNTTKYPPSLLYALMTIGPVLVILSWMEKGNTKFLSPFLVFGRVPMFYYILHFYLLHIGAVGLYVITSGISFSQIDTSFNFQFSVPPEGRYPLIGSYIAWVTVVLVLYPACRWYNHYKSSHNHWWLSYM